MRPNIILAMAAVCFSFSLPVTAATFRAEGSIGENIAPNIFISHGNYDLTLGVQAGGGLNFDQNGTTTTPSIHAQANSLADGGGLHAHGFVEVIKGFSGGDPHEQDFISVANAYATHEITISGPAGNITTALNIHIEGQQSVGASNTPGTPNDPQASNSVSVNLQLDGATLGVGQRALQVKDGTLLPIVENGLLVGFTGNATLTTDSITVAANTPLTLFMSLSVTATVIANPAESYTASANVDFGNTLTFASDRPVFNLPAGYTANSTEAGIVNNIFVPPPPGDYNNNATVDAADYVVWRNGLGTTYTQSGYAVWRAHFGQTAGNGAGAGANAAVPEPATLMLTILAAAGCCLLRRSAA
jgi:hypothetical protein